MASQCYVIDEWLLHDLRGDNTPEAQERAKRFLEKLKEKCDRIAVSKGSPWVQKAYELMTRPNPLIRSLSKYLHLVILRDPQKCLLLEQDDVKALPNISETVPQDDIYLVEIYYSANASTFVTTDEKLYQALSAIQNMNVKRKEDFLKEYLEE